MTRSRGLTLVEMVVVVAIAGITTGLALPAIDSFIKRNAATTALNWLVGNVVYARHSAITYGALVTLCPSADGIKCGGAWHEGTIVFVDRDGDRWIDSGDKLLRRFILPQDEATIKWRSFGNRQYLQMRSTGFTNWQNGNFVYCPRDGDLRFARQLVINLQGRARSSKDIDGDGFVEDRKGKHLRC